MYKVRFDDDSEFMGGDPKKSNWENLPPGKKIASIQYKLMGIAMIFKGFEEYNHIVERAEIINAKDRTSVHRITKVIVMGKWKMRVYQIVFDFQKGVAYQQVTKYGQEYLQESKIVNAQGNNFKSEGVPVSGWFPGAFDPQVAPKMKQM